jgi:hypothetical protein
MEKPQKEKYYLGFFDMKAFSHFFIEHALAIFKVLPGKVPDFG